MYHSKMEQYQVKFSETNPILALARRHKLLARARQASAWGVPDNESTGYSHAELCLIIQQLINEIEKS